MSAKIYIVPDGGLANRFRAMVSGIYLAQKTGREPIIIWHRDDLCNASLADILQVNRIPARIIEPGRLAYSLFYETPRKRNLYLTRVLAPLRFDATYYDAFNLLPYCDNIEALYHEVKTSKGDILIVSGQEYYDFERDMYRNLIVPSAEVQARAAEIMQGRKAEVCFQIRRTDNAKSIAQSPVSLFFEKMGKIGDKSFFLATDDQTVKAEVRKKYGDRAIMNEKPAERHTRAGIIDAMAEILIMSRCDIIYGSAHSSFSVAASWLGPTRLEYLTLFAAQKDIMQRK